ncbi:MAG: HAD family hydrolase [Myxococcota bacterium]|nr:HAD family phosphatase [Myxococcota bacterium]
MPAALFDLDGTLVDNMVFHARAWMQLCERHGIPARVEQFEREFAGKKNGEIIETLLGPGIEPARARALADEKEAVYRRIYEPHVAWVPGAHHLIMRLRAAGTPVAVATAAPRQNREMVLGSLRALGLFDAIVGGEQVANGKPAPDIFLEAAKKLGVPPAGCVVFEDAVNGVLAGKSAEMFTVGICTSELASALAAIGADETARDFTGLTASVLARLGLG